MLHILEKIVPKRNEFDGLEVNFNLLAIRSTDHLPSDLNVIVFAVKDFFPSSCTDKFVVSVLSKVWLQLDI